MAIVDLQRRYRELGRIRIGDTAPADEGKRGRPIRLSTFRLTSPSRELLEQAAALWGGTVGVWAEAPTEGEQHELVTDAETLEVLVPPQDIVGSQYLELWSRGGVQRRCDGATELVSGRPCLCNPERRECSPVTHLAVMLPALADIGTWRVVTRSWNAGAELPGTVELLSKLAAKGAIPRAELGIEARTVKRDGRTQHFTLPVLRVPWSLAQAEREGVPILAGANRPMIVPGEGVTELPADARFAHDRATWGTPPELPEVRDAPSNTGASDPAPQQHAPLEVPPPEVSPIDTEHVEGRAATDGGPEADERAGEGARTPAEGPPIDSPWARYNTALQALPNPHLASAISKRTLRRHELSWPPRRDWPPEVLTEVAELLEGAAGHPAGQGDAS